jgi:hypothetical protein
MRQAPDFLASIFFFMDLFYSMWYHNFEAKTILIFKFIFAKIF